MARHAFDNFGLRAAKRGIVAGSFGRGDARRAVFVGAVRRHRRRRGARRFGRSGRGLLGGFGGDAASRLAAGFALGAVRFGRLVGAALGPPKSARAADFSGFERTFVRRIVSIIFAGRMELGLLERPRARLDVAARSGDLARAVAGALGRAPAQTVGL